MQQSSSGSNREHARADDGLLPELQIAAYYRSPAVRSRIAEYCGGAPEDPGAFSAFELGGYGGTRSLHLPEGGAAPVGLKEFEDLLRDGADVCRSLADRQSTLIQMDIDYVNSDDPVDIYLHPEPCFVHMEPIYHAVRSIFESYGIQTLDLITARGYHLSVRIPAGTPFHTAMVEIGRVGVPLQAKYAAVGGEPRVRLGRAHDGAGRLLEHLAHRVIRKVRGRTEVPVVLADIPRAGGGPFVCLDLSAYGDPLFERYIRCAFASNQKARTLTASRPFTINLPCWGQPLARLQRVRESPSEAARMAESVHTAIPDAPGDDLRWIEEYQRGVLARFHLEFDRGGHDEPCDWPRTYNHLDPQSVPPCVALPLQRPNPALLQPVWIRTVASVLWGLGWHPRSVAGLIRSKYERNFGWESTWYRYDAAARADFYVRLLCGAMACGIDEASDFSCEMQAARCACPLPNCGHDLREYVRTIEQTPGRQS